MNFDLLRVNDNEIRRKDMFQNLNQIIEQVGKDKGLDKEIIIAALEEAMLTAAKKKLGVKQGLEAHYNKETGEIEIFQFKEVVEKVEDESTQMTLEQARQLDEEAQIGDSIGIKVDTSDFGRIAAQTAKQVIIQRVKDAEQENIYMDYKDRKGEIVNGIVQRVERGDIIVNLGRVEALLPKEEQVPKENYRQGDRIRAYILDVKRVPRGPQLILSRTHPNFLVRLFELEVPEISEGIVKIRSVAREPGERAKIAVSSTDLDVDPVGACVGMKGSRVQSVVQELKGEKIDIIPWSDDPTKFVCNALSPAEISRVIIDEENHSMEVIVADDQLSLAIGKKGQNVRLASKLTGWHIDVLSESKAEEKFKSAHASLMKVPGIGEILAGILIAEGIYSIEDLAEISVEDLSQISGILPEKAKTIIEEARKLLEKSREELKEEGDKKGGFPYNGDVKELPGIGEKLKANLESSGFRSIEDISQSTIEELKKVPGIGEALAQKILKFANQKVQSIESEKR
jgi:N utilization substance protein A